jgi:phosphoribosylglycinamide formyltransferase-1
MQNRSKRSPLIVLISGRGSNLRALVQAHAAGELDCEIAGVISNRGDAAGLAWAAGMGLSTRVVDHRHYEDREAFDAALADAVEAMTSPDVNPSLACGMASASAPGSARRVPPGTSSRLSDRPAHGPAPVPAPARRPWVALAGFMRILGSPFVSRYGGRIVNIHPSLLPLYPGLHTHRQALADGALLHGATVHLVTDRLDHGPILAQAIAPVLAGDSETALAERVLSMEHRLYPLALQWLLEDRVTVEGGRVLLDGSDAIEKRVLRHPLLGESATGPASG